MSFIPQPVWPDWAIFCTLANFFKPLATISLPKSLTFLGNFCKGVNIHHFSSEIILGNFYRHWGFLSGHTDGVLPTPEPNRPLRTVSEIREDPIWRKSMRGKIWLELLLREMGKNRLNLAKVKTPKMFLWEAKKRFLGTNRFAKIYKCYFETDKLLDIGCGAVGRAHALDTRYPSSNPALLKEYLIAGTRVAKKRKRQWMAHF